MKPTCKQKTMSVAQASQVYGMPAKTLRKLILDEKLSAAKIGVLKYIPVAELDRMFLP